MKEKARPSKTPTFSLKTHSPLTTGARYSGLATVKIELAVK